MAEIILKDDKSNASELVDLLLKSFIESGMECHNLCETLESIVAPATRNFTIDISNKAKGKSICLKRDGGVVFDVSKVKTYSDLTFVAADQFAYQRYTDEVFFDQREINKSYFLLSLFHEIGHAKSKQENVSLLDVIFGSFVILYNYYFRNPENIKDIKNNRHRFMPAWFIEKEAPIKSKNERNAWAYSLKILRVLERNGFDVFAGLTNEQINAYIWSCLASYEYHYFLQRATHGNIMKMLNKPTNFVHGPLLFGDPNLNLEEKCYFPMQIKVYTSDNGFEFKF